MKDIALLCKDLEQAFGDGYKFEPERICEGGILMKSWPGKTEGMYKTMRIAFKNEGRWPWIKSNDPIEEFLSGEKMLYPSKKEVSTFLKAFHNAPPWTREELEIFARCLLQNGLKVKGKYPSKKSLREI